MENQSFISCEKLKCVKPGPEDMALFLPWACNQLQLDFVVEITRIQQSDYASSNLSSHKSKSTIRNKLKPAQSRIEMDSTQNKEDRSLKYLPPIMYTKTIIKICLVYDHSDNVVQIKFEKNKYIPRELLKLIGLIIEFHKYLFNVTVKRGMNKYTLYEISQFLPHSNITEVCLDDSFIDEANYHLLLETPNQLKQLSLARCNINDTVLETIASRLHCDFPASKTLSILNLASNKITDFGASYLGEALRANRQLLYLNVSDNLLTDEGASHILSILQKFPLINDEKLQSHSRYVDYLKKKSEVITQLINELKSNDYDKKASKKKATKSQPVVIKKPKGLEKDLSMKTFGASSNKNLADEHTMHYEKAEAMATSALGEFDDPFDSTNTELENDVLYCLGNNYLCYLNLSYNSLSYITVKTLLEILKYQKAMNRKPRGLINICIEGNCMPRYCRELDEIDFILESGLMAMNRKMSSAPKKKNLSRSVR